MAGERHSSERWRGSRIAASQTMLRVCGVASLVFAGGAAVVARPVNAAVSTPVVFIGDSLTGICSGDFNSYRDDTLVSLAAAGYLVDATGSRSGSGCYPSDDEHEGVAGDTTGDVAARLVAGLAATPGAPSVAFVLAGTNDVQEGVPVATSLVNLNAIIAALRSENPTVHIVLGQIPPYPGRAPQTADLNTAIASLQSGGSSPVSVVDLNAGITPAHLVSDQIHFNASGAQLVGSRVGTALIGTGRLSRAVTLTFPPFENEEAFVRQQYVDFLGRSADQPGLAYWMGITNADRSNVAAVIESFMRSPEFAPRRGVARLYRAYFNRNPDIGGFDFWTRRIATGQSTLDDVSQFFASSAEFTLMYGSLSDEGFVSRVYENVLGRSPDQAGYAFWVGQMGNGMTRGQVMTRFSESQEYVSRTRSRIDVVVTYRGMLNRMPDDPGFEFWQARVASDPGSLSALINNFFVSPEYGARVAS